MKDTDFIKIKNIDKFLNFIIKFDENSVDFIKNFYGVKLSKDDIKKFKDFIRAIKFKTKGLAIYKISKLLEIPEGRINNWIYKGSLPKVVELLKHYMKLGYPGNNSDWLSINLTAWRFKGPWIRVPKNIIRYSDVISVLEQLEPLKINKTIKKEELFAFLLGIMVGDCNKDSSHKSIRLTKRIILELAKTKKHSNLRLEEFTSLCANSLGLRMKSYRYSKLEKFIKAKRLKRWPEWLQKKVDKHIQEGFSRIQIIEKVLNENNIAITGSNIRLRKIFLISNRWGDKNDK